MRGDGASPSVVLLGTNAMRSCVVRFVECTTSSLRIPLHPITQSGHPIIDRSVATVVV
jgi:hypothetical protein